tara:strand:- start:787 stop:1788 length:1002 start_codon:yes stop_codon:yes gene_type:complete
MKNNSILYFFIFFFISFQFINQESLPDYEPYQRIFLSFGLDFKSDWEPFFILLNFIFNSLGFEYDTFRSFVLGISLFSIYLTYLNLNKISKHHIKINWLLKTVLLFILSIVFFEFFIIRIRAGLSSALFLLGFSYVLISKINKINFLVGLFFFILSSQTHFSTFLILSFFILIPYVTNKLTFNYTITFIYFICSVIVSFLLITQLDISVEERGSNTYSELNFFRFFFISVIPIIIYFIINFFTLINQSFIIRFFPQTIPFRYMAINYISLSIALFCLFPLGYADYSGEAIVRIFSLSSITFVFLINYHGSDYWWLWLYLGLINSLFFVNTVFL